MKKYIIISVIALLVIIGLVIFIYVNKINRTKELELGKQTPSENITPPISSNTDENTITGNVTTPNLEENQIKDNNTSNSSNTINNKNVDNNKENINKGVSTQNNTTSEKPKIPEVPKIDSTPEPPSQPIPVPTPEPEPLPKPEEAKEEYKYNEQMTQKIMSIIKNNPSNDMLTYGYNVVIDSSIITQTNQFTYTEQRVIDKIAWKFGTIKIYVQDYYNNGQYICTQCFLI